MENVSEDMHNAGFRVLAVMLTDSDREITTLIQDLEVSIAQDTARPVHQ